MSKTTIPAILMTCSLLVAGLSGCSREEEPLPPEVPKTQGITESGAVTEDFDTQNPGAIKLENNPAYQNAVDNGMETYRQMVCGAIDEDTYLQRQNSGMGGAGSLSENDYMQGFSEGVATIKARYDQHPDKFERECAQINSTKNVSAEELASTHMSSNHMAVSSTPPDAQSSIASSAVAIDPTQNPHDSDAVAPSDSDLIIDNTNPIVEGDGLEVEPEGIDPTL